MGINMQNLYMNLKEFTEFVDQTAQEWSKEQHQCLIHSIVRKVPEEKRADFIVLLEEVGKVTDTGSRTKTFEMEVRKIDENEIRKEWSRLKKLLSQIENEEFCIQADGYEDYSKGHGCGNWVWEYEETEKVCQVYEDGCRLLQRCVNDGFYKVAVELFDAMMEAEVLVQNVWEDFSMGLEKLRTENLILVNLENLALYVLYALYQENVPENRAQELYNYFSISFFKNTKLEKVLSIGMEELRELPQFWDSWIELLVEKSGDMAQRLLEEAVIYQRGKDGLLATARLASKKHPSLYLKVLEILELSHDSVQQLEVGKEAIDKVEKKYVMRSEIALKTAEAAIRLDDKERTEDYWLEAFISKTTPVEYLRLMLESREQNSYQKLAKDIILSAKTYGSSDYRLVKELTENIISDYDKNILRFLDGDFELTMDICLKVKQSLGWSSTFIKCGISLLLLLLLNDNDLKLGCAKMAEDLRHDMQFDAASYFKGTSHALEYGVGQVAKPKELDIFWRCFTGWKVRTHVAVDQAERYLLNLENIIDKRVTAIISGQYRAHYSDVAALAAALGEVKESRGEEFYKERFLQKYKAAYPRHSSFHASLREYGIMDIKKNKKR